MEREFHKIQAYITKRILNNVVVLKIIIFMGQEFT